MTTPEPASLELLRDTLQHHVPPPGGPVSAPEVISLGKRRQRTVRAVTATAALLAVTTGGASAVALSSHRQAPQVPQISATAPSLPAPEPLNVDDATARTMLQPCLDDNDSAIASGGPGRPSGDDWRVLAARSVRPRTVGAAIHLVHGTHVVNPITMIVAEQASTGDWTVCVVQTTSSGRYGLSNSAGPGRLDPGAPPDNGLTRVNGNFGNHAVAFTVGRYGSKVTGVRVASSAGVSDAALLRNGVYIGVVPVSPTAYRFPPTGELRSITATAVTR